MFNCAYLLNLALWFIYLFIYLGFYVAFNTVQVILRWIVGRAEETSTYRFCTVNCRPTASNYQLSHLRPYREPNPGLRGGRQGCYHSATVAPFSSLVVCFSCYLLQKYGNFLQFKVLCGLHTCSICCLHLGGVLGSTYVDHLCRAQVTLWPMYYTL